MKGEKAVKMRLYLQKDTTTFLKTEANFPKLIKVASKKLFG